MATSSFDPTARDPRVLTEFASPTPGGGPSGASSRPTPPPSDLNDIEAAIARSGDAETDPETQRIRRFLAAQRNVA